jgi:hypothetical protein
MPRRPSDSVVTHRIELGVKEREQLDAVVAPIQFARIATGAGIVVGAGAIALASYGLWWFFDSREKITERAKDAIRSTPLIVDEDDPWYYDVAGPMPVLGWRIAQRAFGL